MSRMGMPCMHYQRSVFEANINDLFLGVRTLFLLLLGFLFVHAETTPVAEILLRCAGTGHVRFYLTHRCGAEQLCVGARRWEQANGGDGGEGGGVIRKC